MMEMFTASRYLKYILLSRHRKGHGIHSPFVFNFVSDILRNKTEPDFVFIIEKLRKSMLADHRTIEVNDLGAGSKKMKTSLRKVSDIARYSAVPEKYGILLSRLAETFGKPVILEFGTSLGISTMYMATSCPEATVITMEGCTASSEIAAENFREAGLKNIRIINGSFDSILPEIRNENIRPGLVFIDGNHRKDATISYFNQVSEMSDNNSVVIFDDINASREMAEAWFEIKNNEKVTITIDIFRMGFVFFRKGFNRFSYVIRY